MCYEYEGTWFDIKTVRTLELPRTFEDGSSEDESDWNLLLLLLLLILPGLCIMSLALKRVFDTKVPILEVCVVEAVHLS